MCAAGSVVGNRVEVTNQQMNEYEVQRRTWEERELKWSRDSGGTTLCIELPFGHLQ